MLPLVLLSVSEVEMFVTRRARLCPPQCPGAASVLQHDGHPVGRTRGAERRGDRLQGVLHHQAWDVALTVGVPVCGQQQADDHQ